jgi:hypothetical protein
MADAVDLHIQGLCRFSYPCTGGFKKYHDSLAERRTALYDPQRLERRLIWFTRIALPGLAAQTDPDFTLHLLIGDDLPAPWRDRLQAAIAPVSQINLHALPPMDHRAACRQILRGGRDPARAHVAEFRLDDDDAVAVTYVETLRRLHRKMTRVAGPKGRVALDHGRGVVLEAKGNGVVIPHALVTHCWSAALAFYAKAEDTGTIMDFPHNKIWMRMPFVNLTDQTMFIRGDHGMNDAATPWSGAGAYDVPEAEWPNLLQSRFAVDLPGFRADWARLMAT